jgi:hypothetical protein
MVGTLAVAASFGFGMVAGETCTTGQDHLRALVDQPRWRRRRSAGRWRPAPSALQSDRSERWVGSAISSAHQTFARCGDVLGTRWSTRQKPNPPSGYGRHRVTSSILLLLDLQWVLIVYAVVTQPRSFADSSQQRRSSIRHATSTPRAAVSRAALQPASTLMPTVIATAESPYSDRTARRRRFGLEKVVHVHLAVGPV